MSESDARCAVVAGPDPDGLGDALEAAGVAVVRVASPVFAADLADAGIEEADLYVLTDMAEATSIPVAKELNADVRAVVYAEGSLPEFAAGVADLAVDPALLDVAVVADELAG